MSPSSHNIDSHLRAFRHLRQNVLFLLSFSAKENKTKSRIESVGEMCNQLVNDMKFELIFFLSVAALSLLSVVDKKNVPT